jgi:hypothetical protein
VSARALLASLACLLALAAAGCGGGGEGTDATTGVSAGRGGGEVEGTGKTESGSERNDPRPGVGRGAAEVALSTCPPGLPSCRSTRGRIVYVERVDPDGDGDAHFVIVDPQGITLPGLTAIDVRKGLRPDPLPGPGDLVSAAGPVQTGSFGQSQIHALELHVAR